MAPGRAGLAALIALSLLVACSDDGGETTTGDTTDAGELVDGRHFGRVTELDPASGSLGFDVADLDGDRIDDPDAEVAYDGMQGDRFRHATQLVRWRPDRDPESCSYDQLDRPVPELLSKVFAGD